MVLHEAVRYKSWADRRTLDAVAALDAHRDATTLDFARQQLHHLVRVQELFRARALGQAEPHDSTNADPVPALGELDQRLTASNEWLQSWLAGLEPPALAQPVRFRFTDGQRGCLSREELVFHLVNHATYHRGAIGHALDRCGAARPADTYTVFIHAAQPQRRQ